MRLARTAVLVKCAVKVCAIRATPLTAFVNAKRTKQYWPLNNSRPLGRFIFVMYTFIDKKVFFEYGHLTQGDDFETLSNELW